MLYLLLIESSKGMTMKPCDNSENGEAYCDVSTERGVDPTEKMIEQTFDTATMPLDRMLPVVRTIRALRICSRDDLEDGIAVYQDRIVLFTGQSKKPLPEGVFESQGFVAFGEERGGRKCVVLPHADIRRILIGPLGFYSKGVMEITGYGYVMRIEAMDGRVAELRVPQQDALSL